jgi:L-lactate oxidase
MTLMRRDLLLSGALAAAGVATAGPTLAQETTPNPPGPPTPYPPREDKAIPITNLYDLEDDAKKALPLDVFNYIAAGSGSNLTRYENVVAFDRIHIEPQQLSGHADVDLTTEILGSRLKLPIMVAPLSNQGLAHELREEGIAKAANAVGALMISATRSNLSLEETAAFTAGPKWFQLDVPRDIGYLRELLQRAKEARYTAIVPTIDSLFENPRGEALRLSSRPSALFGRGNLPRAVANPAEAERKYDDRKRNLSWDDMEDIKNNSGLPVVVKGVLSPKVAMLAFKRGMDAVYVSNYGGRTFDGVNATIAALPRIVDAVQDSLPIILDGGIRRGSDVFKAIALGAKAVACGRPLLYGLALGGSLGAQSVLEYLRDNLTIVMQLAGTRTLQDVKAEYLAAE